MLTFLTAVFFLLISPGPGVLTTAGVGSAYGFRPGLAYVTGLFIGSNLVMLGVATGLFALIAANENIRLVLAVLSALYLGWMAVKIVMAGSKVGFMAARTAPSLMDGVLLQFVNPKAYVVGTTLFGGFAFLPDSYWLEVAIKFLLINLVWVPVHLLWLWFGVALKRMELPARAQFAVNLGMATALLLVVGLALWSQFGTGVQPLG